MTDLHIRLQTVNSPGRTAGIVLLTGFILYLAALMTIIINGVFPAFSAMLQGSLQPLASYTAVFRQVHLFYALGWIVQFLGFGLLTRLLLDAGEDQVVILAFLAMSVATVFGLLEATFHMSVTIWAAQEAARTGTTPAFYPVLQQWIDRMQLIYAILSLFSLAGFGWALLRTNLLPMWVEMASLVWGSGLLLVLLIRGIEIPAEIFIFPPVIGLTLLLN